MPPPPPRASLGLGSGHVWGTPTAATPGEPQPSSSCCLLPPSQPSATPGQTARPPTPGMTTGPGGPAQSRVPCTGTGSHLGGSRKRGQLNSPRTIPCPQTTEPLLLKPRGQAGLGRMNNGGLSPSARLQAGQGCWDPRKTNGATGELPSPELPSVAPGPASCSAGVMSPGASFKDPI